MAYKNHNRSRWYESMGHPPFAKGDYITPDQSWSYYAGKQHMWPHGEFRVIKSVRKNLNGDWVLAVHNPVVGRLSEYSPKNFIKQEGMTHVMAGFARTKYFAVKLNMSSTAPEEHGLADNGGLHLADVNTDPAEDSNHNDTTRLRDSRQEVLQDVKMLIEGGEKWAICQMLAVVDGEPPRPPVRVTELR